MRSRKWVVLAFAASALSTASRVRADDAAPAAAPLSPLATQSLPPPATQDLPAARGPNWVMLGGGLIVFGNSYAIASIVGATSSYQPDRNLFIPVLGPWIDLATRAACSDPTGSSSCHDERTNRVSLVIDGAFQGIGVLAIAGALAFQWSHAAATADGPARRSFELTPVQYASGGAGLAASGSF